MLFGAAHGAELQPPSSAAPGAPLIEARQLISEWVRARQLLASTESDWESHKEMLEQTRVLFEREHASILEQMERLSTNSVKVDKERIEAEAKLAEARSGLEAMRGIVGVLEGRIRSMAIRLPQPLQQTVQPLLARLPEDPLGDRPSVPERMQTVVGFLNEVDKFNAAITVTSDRKPNDAGEQVAVDVVYLGLAVAYYVDTDGKIAGIGRPGATGWEWEPASELAAQIMEVVAVYRNQKPAVFVKLPLRVSGATTGAAR